MSRIHINLPSDAAVLCPVRSGDNARVERI
jgi:hypothetical protein